MEVLSLFNQKRMVCLFIYPENSSRPELLKFVRTCGDLLRAVKQGSSGAVSVQRGWNDCTVSGRYGIVVDELLSYASTLIAN